MGAPRGVSAVTKAQIRDAARDLFAERGIEKVTIREIAAAAGVSHGLVHRYFGSKSEMVREIVTQEIDRLLADASPSDHAAIGEVLSRVWSDRRTLLVILRAELDGLEPEKLVEHQSARPLHRLADWLGQQEKGLDAVDPRMASMVLGAAVFGLAALTPWLSSAVGLEDMDEALVRERCLQTLIQLIAAAAGRPMTELAR